MATFDTIGAAVKTQIDGASLSVTTVVRKEGIVQEDDPLPPGTVAVPVTNPFVVISLAQDQGENWATTRNPAAGDYGTVGRGFVIAIEIYTNAQGEMETNLASRQNLIQSIKRLLNKPFLTGAGTVWDTRLIQNDAWEGQPFREGCEQSSFGLAFESSEQRN